MVVKAYSKGFQVFEGLRGTCGVLPRADMEALVCYIGRLAEESIQEVELITGLSRAMRVCQQVLQTSGVGGCVYMTPKERLDVYQSVRAAGYLPTW